MNFEWKHVLSHMLAFPSYFRWQKQLVFIASACDTGMSYLHCERTSFFLFIVRLILYTIIIYTYCFMLVPFSLFGCISLNFRIALDSEFIFSGDLAANKHDREKWIIFCGFFSRVIFLRVIIIITCRNKQLKHISFNVVNSVKITFWFIWYE